MSNCIFVARKFIHFHSNAESKPRTQGTVHWMQHDDVSTNMWNQHCRVRCNTLKSSFSTLWAEGD